MISGVADRVPDRVGALVYLDAFVLENGQSLHDTLPPDQKKLQIELAQQHGEGWKVPPIPAGVFGVNATDLEWVNGQCTMQSLATFQQAITLTRNRNMVENVTFILATGWSGSPFHQFYEGATNERLEDADDAVRTRRDAGSAGGADARASWRRGDSVQPHSDGVLADYSRKIRDNAISRPGSSGVVRTSPASRDNSWTRPNVSPSRR